MNFLKLEFVAFSNVVKGWFHYIFPEFPAIGVVVIGGAVLMFLFYLLRSGLDRAVQMTAMVLGVCIFVLLAFHYTNSLFLHWLPV